MCNDIDHLQEMKRWLRQIQQNSDVHLHFHPTKSLIAYSYSRESTKTLISKRERVNTALHNIHYMLYGYFLKATSHV